MRKELQNRRPAFAFNILDSGGTPYRLTTSFENENVKGTISLKGFFYFF